MKESFEAARQFSRWLDEQVAGVTLPGERRVRMAAICFGVAQEHHAAIVALLGAEPALPSSAFALGRPLFEAYVRGTWLAHCASDDDLEEFWRGETPGMPKLLTAIEQFQDDDEPKRLREIYNSSWSSMCGLTHGGSEHHLRWSSGSVLEPAYSTEDLSRLLNFSCRLGLVSVAGLAQLSKDGADLCRRILENGRLKMPPRFGAA
jgi:hypothetical protein